MILAALLLVIVMTVGVLIARRSPGVKPRPLSSDQGRRAGVVPIPSYVEALLSRWRDAGLVSEEQVGRIRSFESSAVGEPTTVQRSRVHAIAEGLGYLGGMLGLTGVVVLVARFWDDFGDAMRLGIPLVAAVIFIVAGHSVARDRSPSSSRLQTFVWLLGVVASGVVAWVAVDVVFEIDDVRRHWLAVGIVAGIVSGALWFGRNRPVQHITTFAGATIALGTFIGEFASAGFSGIGIWIAGVIVLALSVRSTRSAARVSVLCASIISATGAILTVTDWRGPGLVFAVLTGLALLGPSSVDRFHFSSPTPLIMGIVGSVMLVQSVPMAIAHFADQAGVATGLVTWVCGSVVFVAVGLHRVRMELVFTLASGVLFVGGAAVTGAQSAGFATLFGLATSVGLIAVGTRPGRALMSVFGLVGIAVFIPWMIGHYFPGEGRVPLLIIVSGILLVGIAVALTRLGGRLRGEVRGHA